MYKRVLRPWASIVSISTIMLSILLLSSPALAQGEPPPPVETSEQDATPLTMQGEPGPDGAVGTNQPLRSNPYGCIGQTDRPHASHHVPGNVNVVARTRCAVAVPEIYVQTTLQRRNCFTVFCWWETVGNPGVDRKMNAHLAQANSAGSCIPGTYRGISSHSVRGPDGQTYIGQTEHVASVTC
jgi:hypothetical protein